MTSQSSENFKLNSLIKHDKLLFKKGIQGLTFSGPDPDQDLGIVTFSTAVPPSLPIQKLGYSAGMHRADFLSLRNEFRCLRIAVTPNGGDERKSNPANWQC